MKKDNTNQNTSFSMKIFTKAKKDGMYKEEFNNRKKIFENANIMTE